MIENLEEQIDVLGEEYAEARKKGYWWLLILAIFWGTLCFPVHGMVLICAFMGTVISMWMTQKYWDKKNVTYGKIKGTLIVLDVLIEECRKQKLS